MQDKYVGDVGDFGKYGLLNEIAKQSGGEIILGINWYYATREEIGNTDGNHIDYLDEKNENVIRYRACFPELYDKLRIIVKEKRRRVYCIENSSILPQNTIFYSRPIPFTGFSDAERSALRKAWFDESLCRLAKADIIFLDPDNGIRPDLARKGATDAIKYVFADEIENYYRQGKSLVIYNHRDRRPKVEYERKLLICRDYVKHPDDIKVIRFKRVSVRDYIFVIQKRHRDLISRAITALTIAPRDFFFETYAVEMEKPMMRKSRY